MALIFCDSFDHYANADVLQKWTSQDASSSQSPSAGNGRRGTTSWRMTTARDMNKAVATQTTYVAGAAFKCASLPGSTVTIIAFKEGATVHATLRLAADGSLIVARNTTQLAASAAGVISAGAYFYLEFKAKIDNTTGTTEVWVNGAVVGALTLTGQDTQNAGTTSITIVTLSGITAVVVDWDDLYICDTTGGSPNDTFLGDVRVDAYLPNGNGNSSQLVGSDADSTDNYLLVDEASADGDTTYVESATASNKDTYLFGNMSHTPSVISGVQIVASAKKDDAGARSITTVTRSGGTDYDGATVALSTAYLMYMDVRGVNPNTSAAWTKTNFDSAEFGVKVAA
jgi:hypothetical protein